MRIGVSLPDNLLGKFDEITKKRGYSSSSEGIRDAIRSYISYHEWMDGIPVNVDFQPMNVSVTIVAEPVGVPMTIVTETVEVK